MSKNPLLARVIGESTGDVVPVIANLPRATHRSRLEQSRQKGRGADEAEPDNSVARMVGEAKREEEIIPDDAQPVDKSEMTVGKPLRDPKEVVLEPSHPTGEKEKYQTPYAALTAPDVTPMSTQPIDPSEVPGTGTPEKFTARELEQAQLEEPVTGGQDTAVRAMDVLLGRNRASKPATQPGEFQQAGAITTEEQALAALNIQSPVMEAASAKAAQAVTAAANGGSAMPPPPPPSDGSAIYGTFRRFAG